MSTPRQLGMMCHTKRCNDLLNYTSAKRNVLFRSVNERLLATLSNTAGTELTEDVAGLSVKAFSELPTASINSISKGTSFFFKYLLTGKSHLYFDDMHKNLGPIYRSKFGAFDLVLTSDPHSLETVLRNEGKYPTRIRVPMWTEVRDELKVAQGFVTGEGEQWYKLRKVTEKPFLRVKDVSTYRADVNEVCSELIDRLRERRRSNGSVPNIQEHIFLFSCEATGTVIFNTRMGFFGDDPHVRKLIQGVHDYFDLSAKVMFFPMSVVKWVLPQYWKRFKVATVEVYSTGCKYIDSQKALADQNKEDVKGFLGYILQQKHLTRSDINTITSEMLGAGIDTTSNAIQFLLYELARNPDIQEMLFEEISRVMGPGDSPTMSDIEDMELLRAVVKETLRLYPVGNTVGRIIPKDLVLSGYNIPAGNCVIASLYTTGRNPDLFPEPESFRPERWLRRNLGKQTNTERAFSALPFGFGTRSCVGRRIAELEMHLFTFHMVKNFHIQRDFTGEIGIKTEILLKPDKPVDVKIIDRK